jgi:hypothetical protein
MPDNDNSDTWFKGHIQWDLTREKEYQEVMIALGSLAASFNDLESRLKDILLRLIKPKEPEVAVIISQERRTFVPLADLVGNLFTVYVKDEAKLLQIKQKLQEAKTLAEDRNKFLHSAWYRAATGQRAVIRIKYGKQPVDVYAEELVNKAAAMDDCSQKLLNYFDESFAGI